LERCGVVEEGYASGATDFVFGLHPEIGLALGHAPSVGVAVRVQHQLALHLICDAELVQHLHEMDAADGTRCGIGDDHGLGFEQRALARFRKSKSVGAVFGLTCAKYQSGEMDWNGKISRCGDEMMRTMLYEAAQSMLRSKKWSWLKAWAMQIARRRGMKKAIVALARRLAVIMHRMWVDGTEFRWTKETAAA
jgi:transposase